MKKILFSLLAFCLSTAAFAQFTTNGANLYFTGGKVGIGTPTPSNILTLRASNALEGIRVESNQGQIAYLGNLGSSSNIHRGLLEIYNNGASSIKLAANTSTDSYINAGNVGIGTTSPGALLHVSSATSNAAKIRLGRANNLSADYLEISTVGGGGRFTQSGGSIDFYTSTSTTASNDFALRIGDNGNVGIGTTSPTTKLDIRGELKVLNTGSARSVGYFYAQGSGEAGIYFDASNGDGSGSDYGSLLQKDDLSIVLNNYGNGPIQFRTNNEDRMMVSGLGNVGIGTTDPHYPLSVAGTINSEANGDYYGAWFGGEARTAQPSINLGEWHNYRGKIYWDNADRKLVFETKTATTTFENTLVLEDGNVGIGTTSPTSKLHVNGNAKIGGNFTSAILRLEATDEAGAPARAVGLELHGYESRGKGIYITDKNTSDKWFIGEGYNYDGIGIGYSATNSTEYSVNTKFIVKGNGNIGIGTTSPTEKLSVDGNILAKKVRVSIAAADWPDYVFTPSFELRDLGELETYIKQNQHLPEVPSAKEVEANGLDLGKMDATLLKKVEELTLYMIEMNKNQEKLIKEVETLKKENASLRKVVRGTK